VERAFVHDHFDFGGRIAAVGIADDTKGAVATVAQRIEGAHNQCGIVGLAHVDSDRLARHGLFVELDQLALAVAPVDQGDGAGRVQQIVGQHRREIHRVRHGVEDARGDNADAQAVVEPRFAIVAGGGEIDHHFDREDHQCDRCDKFDRKPGKRPGHSAGLARHLPSSLAKKP